MQKQDDFCKKLAEALVFIINEQKRREILNALEILHKYKDAPLKLEIERKKKRRKPLSPEAQKRLKSLETKAKMYEYAKKVFQKYVGMKRKNKVY